MKEDLYLEREGREGEGLEDLQDYSQELTGYVTVAVLE